MFYFNFVLIRTLVIPPAAAAISVSKEHFMLLKKNFKEITLWNQIKRSEN